MKKPILLAVVIGMFASACVKDDLDVADLDNNPFDAEYVGPEIFTVESAGLVTEVQNGVPNTFLRVEVRVRTELFLRNTPFQWRYRAVGAADWSNFQYNLPSTVLIVDDHVTGQEYCWQFQLANDGSVGTGNTICATAE